MTNSISWLAATRTTPAMSGGFISTSFATSEKNAAASPCVVMGLDERWTDWGNVTDVCRLLAVEMVQ